MKNHTSIPTKKTSFQFSRLNITLLGTLALLIGLIAGVSIGFTNKQEIAHINSNMVFSEFTLTQEFQSNLTNIQQSRQTILSNLELRISNAESVQNMSTDSLNALVQEYSVKSKYFEQNNQEQLAEYNERIWNHLNQYIQDYSEEKGYDYILGANGSGSLMGANPGKDLTKEIIAYVNQKYSGN